MISQKVAQYIKQHGIKQKDIAEAIGMSTSTISKALTGKRPLFAQEYGAICDFLKVPYSYFCYDDIYDELLS